MPDSRPYPRWLPVLMWTAYAVLAPIWLTYSIFETIRNEIIARRRLDGGNKRDA